MLWPHLNKCFVTVSPKTNSLFWRSFVHLPRCSAVHGTWKSIVGCDVVLTSSKKPVEVCDEHSLGRPPCWVRTTLHDPVVSLASGCVNISRAISVFIAAWRRSQITCRCCPGRAEQRLGGRSRSIFLSIMDRHRRSNTHLTGYRSSRHNEMTLDVSCLTQLIWLSSCVQEHTLTNKYLTGFNTLWGQQWHNKVCPIMTSHCNAYEVVTSRHMADVRAILCSER